jgi:hypothetical protein
MPGSYQGVAMKSHVPEDITELVRRKSGVDRHREVMKPEFGFAIS